MNLELLAANSGWDDTALRSASRHGLAKEIKDLIVQDPPTFNNLITLALQMDDRFWGATPGVCSMFGELGLDAHDPSPVSKHLPLRVDLRSHSLVRRGPPSADPRRRKSPCSWAGRGFAYIAGKRGTSSGLVPFGQKIWLTGWRGPSEPY